MEYVTREIERDNRWRGKRARVRQHDSDATGYFEWRGGTVPDVPRARVSIDGSWLHMGEGGLLKT